MKNKITPFSKVFTLLLVVLLGTAPDALAAGTRSDNSGVFVWSFLALCGLIVLAQLLPRLIELLHRTAELEAKRKVALGTTPRHRTA